MEGVVLKLYSWQEAVSDIERVEQVEVISAGEQARILPHVDFVSLYSQHQPLRLFVRNPVQVRQDISTFLFSGRYWLFKNRDYDPDETASLTLYVYDGASEFENIQMFRVYSGSDRSRLAKLKRQLQRNRPSTYICAYFHPEKEVLQFQAVEAFH